jgi:polar amino acid transport system permease protein
MTIDLFLSTFLNLEVIERYLPYMLRGLGQTALLALLAVPIGFIAGIMLATLTTHSHPWVRRTATVYVDLFRAFPPLVLLLLIHTGLPHFGLRPPPLVSVLLTLLINSSSYYGEIVRGGFLSVTVGVIHAARATGMSYLQTEIYIRIPIAVRNVMPDLLSNTLELIKLTSIAAVVTYVELTQAARVVQGLTFNATPIILAAVLYFILLFPLAYVIRQLERRSVG